MPTENTRFVKVKITAELLIQEDYLSDPDTLVEDLSGEYIKIKSGVYENIADGNVSSVEVLGFENIEVEVESNEE